MLRENLLSTRIRGIHMSEWWAVMYIALLCIVSPSGISFLENVITCGTDTLATCSSLFNVIEASTNDFLNLPRILSLCSLNVNNKPEIETYAGVLDNCSIKNR